jgi:hypothetical protein
MIIGGTMTIDVMIGEDGAVPRQIPRMILTITDGLLVGVPG